MLQQGTIQKKVPGKNKFPRQVILSSVFLRQQFFQAGPLLFSLG